MKNLDKRLIKRTSVGDLLRRALPTKSMVAFSSGLFAIATFQSAVAAVNLAATPVFLKESVDPNLMFIFDDSGSMSRDYMPDSIFNELALFGDNNGPIRWAGGRLRIGNFWYYSSRVNTVFYNPDIEYKPPFNPDGSGRFPDSDFEDAWTDGYEQSGSVDLGERFPTRRFTYEDSAFYYRFNSTPECESQPKDNDCYSLVFLDDESDEQQQNFANWYSYYSTRVYASRAGISEAFFDLPENIRLGYGAINSGNRTIDNETTQTLISGVRPYSSDRREQFLSWLQSKTVGGGTPLREALRDTGNYYSRTDNFGPWGNEPGTDDNSSQVECRPSYTIMMTDGIWNGGNPGVGNSDGTAGPSHVNPKPGGADFNYQANSPFSDDHSNTLADVAMEYWKTDLRPDLADRVPTAGIDEAFWQHMTTFTIGLGVEGTISEADAFAAISTGDQINWPAPSRNAGSENIDDLLHAAVNGRGGFASAQNPDEFSREIASFLDTVIARSQTSASSASVSAAVLRTDTLGFFAGFRSEDWSGTLTAFNFESGDTVWDAEEVLRQTPLNERNIYTHNGSTAVALEDLDDLSPAQQQALNADPENPGLVDDLGQNRIDWLRGSGNAHPTFRSREFTLEDGTTELRLLGDIVNADPLFVGTQNFGFRRLPGDEGSSYGSFRSSTSYQERTKALYAASNSGYLHAFDSESGDELFAYMPGELLNTINGRSAAQISDLMSPNYTHRYFGDGSPNALDAYINVNGSTGWRTVLLGSMGAGGRTVYALDITEPNSFTESNVLWEFTHPDLGYGVKDVQTARLEDGSWVAVFGNGYNGADEKSSLFVVNLSDGTLVEQIETGAGSGASSNGLSTPVITTFPKTDGITRYAYAGDIQGNMWRFDLTGNSNQWSSTKLFTAVGPNNNSQPITSAPRVTLNPSNLDELYVVFGTGSFIRNGDDAFDEIQSLYGIRDDLTQANLARNDLLEQEITSKETVQVARADGTGNNTATIRYISDNATDDVPRGWHLDLTIGGSREGERVISQPTFPFGLVPDRVRFSTVIPESDPCSTGRTGFILDLKLSTGGNPDDPVFDLDGDGKFNAGDIPNGGGDTGPGSIEEGDGTRTKTIIDKEGKTESVIDGPNKKDPDNPCADGMCIRTLEDGIGRQTWEQLR